MTPSCQLAGKCGPDVTEWFMNEAIHHYIYGVKMKLTTSEMKSNAWYLWFLAEGRCQDVYLKDFVTTPPFTDIVTRYKVPLPLSDTLVGDIPLLKSGEGSGPVGIGAKIQAAIYFLKVVEFGAYGLAVDYASVKYDLNAGSCGECGIVVDDNGDDHNVISLCDHCIDASDLGNIMFGIGGYVRGFRLNTTYLFAAGYNAITDEFGSLSELKENALASEDAKGAKVGWDVAANSAFFNSSGFCNIINSWRSIGYNDNAQKLKNCHPCSTVTDPGFMDPSSLNRRSGYILPNSVHGDTIDELNHKRDGLYGRAFTLLEDELLKRILE
jgi:hypothetical protein